MKQKLIPIVGLDFIDAYGVRIFNFQLCERRDSGLVTVAIVDMAGEKIARKISVDRLEARMKGIVRLARKYLGRSIPQVFRKQALPA